MEDTITEQEIDQVINCLKSGEYTQGKVVDSFEKKFAAWNGSKYAVMANSGSSANLLMITMLKQKYNLKDGDEVIVPSVTWPTTVYPIIQNNLQPVFCDVDNGFNLDINSLKRMYSKKTKAVFLVHLLGQTAQLNEVISFCQERDIVLIEDCCESLGAKFNSRKVGNFGVMGSFSFYFGHHMTTIEGGIVSTNDFETYDLLKSIRSHGWIRDSNRQDKYQNHKHKDFVFDIPGYNLRSTNVNAAIGLVQLEKLDSAIKKRIENHRYFLQQTGRLGLKTQKVDFTETSSFCLAIILENKDQRDYLIKRLAEKGIESRPVVAGNLLRQPVFNSHNYRRDDMPMADLIHDCGLYLPNHQFINNEKIDYMINSIKLIVEEFKMAPKKMLPQIEPWIDEEELKEITEVIRSNWLTEGKKTEQFETMFKNLTGTRHSQAFCNGTATLYTALKVLGIKEGDEVIVPNITFTATINSIIFTGARPVIVDVDRRTFNLDPEQIESKITEKTKVIMPVHLYGQSADMEAIMAIAKKYNLFVVEDAAQGVGVKFNQRHVGTFGDFGSFSFYGNKTITTGEGGMLITNKEKLAAESYMFKNHGRLEKGVFVHNKIGFNFSFTEMQAAIGVAQLNKLPKIIEAKRKIREWYYQKLRDIPEIEFTYIDPRCTPVHWFTSILVPDPEKLAEHLKTQGIQTRRFFFPINKQPCYNFQGDFPNSEYAYQHGLSLPSTATLSEEQVINICEKIKGFYQNKI